MVLVCSAGVVLRLRGSLPDIPNVPRMLDKWESMKDIHLRTKKLLEVGQPFISLADPVSSRKFRSAAG